MAEKFKLSQGSYDDEIEYLMNTAARGQEYINNKVSAANVSAADIERLSDALESSYSPAVGQTARAINEGNITEAVKIIMSSEQVKNAVGNNEYYKQAEAALAGLSEEEIMIINEVLRQLRKG
jgi:hypothetical protein